MPRNLADTYLQQTTIQSVFNEVALVVKGVSGQTLNLQQWQNSAGTVVASIDRFGTIYMNGSASYLQSSDGNSYLFYTPGTTGGTNSEMVADHAGSIPLAVKGAASQTADLQQWQSAAGTVLASVESNGRLDAQEISINGDMAINENRVVIATKVVNAWDATTGFTMWGGGTNPGVLLDGSAAGSVPLVVKGFASQTADLQQWQNSAGTAQAYVNAGGDIANPTHAVFSTYLRACPTAEFEDSYSILVKHGAAAKPAVVVRGAASQTANLQEWQDSAGTMQARVASDGRFTTVTGLVAPTIQANSFTGPYIDTTNGAGILVLNRTTVGNVPLVVKGMASQTGDLQQWQDSAGAVLATLSSNGSFLTVGGAVKANYFADPSFSGPLLFAGTAGFIITNQNVVTNVPLILKGMAAQTGDLQQWQNSAGTVLARVFAGGGMSVGADGGQRLNVNTGGLTTTTVSVLPAATSWVGLVVQGLESQTADLQQWQTSAGTVMGYVNPAGALHVKRLGVGATPPTTDNIGFIPTLYINDLWGYQDGFIGIGTTRVSAQHVTIAVHSTVSNTGLVVKGMASQTGDLQQWQNSGGSRLLGVLSDGGLIFAAGNYASFGEGSNVFFGTSTGTKLGTETTQKLAFWGATPVVQPAGIANADGTLGDITTKFNSLIAKLEAIGLLAVV